MERVQEVETRQAEVDRDPELLDGLVGGRYRLLERVGAGGMATVYRARDERLAREVAVKVIARRLAHDAGFVRLFRREAQLCARLAHPNIISVLDAGVEPRDFIVMELVPGLDAGVLVRQDGRLTPDEAVHLVAQVCEALAYAHDHDVIHQDVSPRNILVRPDATAMLTDFGLASDPSDRAERQETGGTPGYVAPEVLCGGTPSPRSDLYSLGGVAYTLLAGSARARPVDPECTAPLATAAPRRVPLAEARPGLPSALTDAVQRAVADDPYARQASVAEFRGQLIDAVQRRRAARPPSAVRAALPSAA
jgi:eukaryotic-like serine/threonine-protein kinase